MGRSAAIKHRNVHHVLLGLFVIEAFAGGEGNVAVAVDLKQAVAVTAADFVGEAQVEADDEEVAADEGEDGGEAHADCHELAATGPPQVDDDDCIVEQLGQDVGHDVADDVAALTGVTHLDF